MHQPNEPKSNRFIDIMNLSEPSEWLSAFSDLFTQIHQPASPEEETLIDELVVAQCELLDTYKRSNELVQLQQLEAPLKFENMREAEFTRLERQWRRHPELFRDSFAETWFGAMIIAGIWNRAMRRLSEPEPSISLDEALELLLTEGLSDQVQKAEADAWWLMSRFLAMHPQPDLAIKNWIRRSKSTDPTINTQRAQNEWAKAPDSTTSRQELLSRVAERCKFWNAQFREAKTAYETQRDFYIRSFQADSSVKSNMKACQATRKSAQASVDRIEARLLKARERREKRQSHHINEPGSHSIHQPGDRARPKPAKSPATASGLFLYKNFPAIKSFIAQISPEISCETLLQMLPGPEHDALAEEVAIIESSLSSGELTSLPKVVARLIFKLWPFEEIVDESPTSRYEQLLKSIDSEEIISALSDSHMEECNARMSNPITQPDHLSYYLE